MIRRLLLLNALLQVVLSSEVDVVTPHNASSTLLSCPPAENFIQTHMAPDFLSPQLVRRLDWFHEDALIASYQQNVVVDSSRQWWVSDKRFQLDAPFYALRITPVLPEDAGHYRCRLETDPLFALTMSSAQVELAVLVPPVPPSSPEVKEISNHSATLSWTHNIAKAHRPIVRYSVAVRNVAKESRFIIPAPSNATSVIVDNLDAFTLYSFSVRAENVAGHSDFGPETQKRTKGEAPSSPPRLISISNGSSGCVVMHVLPPEHIHGDVKSYTVMTTREEDKEPRIEEFPSHVKMPLTICQLVPNSIYVFAVTVENDYGISPPLQKSFHTEDTSLLPVALSDVTLTSSIGKPEVLVTWKMDYLAKKLSRFNLYYKVHNRGKWKVEHLPIGPSARSSFSYLIKNLEPITKYHVRLSASTTKGESPKTKEVSITTDHSEPEPTELSFLSFDCKTGVRLEWPSLPGRIEYHLEIENGTRTYFFNTTLNKLEVLDLSLKSEYIVRLQTIATSIVDNRTRLVGPWGPSQVFILNEDCSYQSSICASHSKCQPLVHKVNTSRNLTYVVVVVALCLFVVLCVLVVYSLKGRCLDMKTLLKQKKKKREKCVFVDELSPLVYDSTGCEDIPVELFYGYCEDLSRNNKQKYRTQFEMIENMTSVDMNMEVDVLQQNLDKNRYLNIGAMEKSRVRLTSANGSDYINANYIDSCDQLKAYIATQAPLPSTFSDFWAMVWQEKSNVIVVITNLVEDGRRKCDMYWPSTIDQPQTHGSLVVTLVSESSNAHFDHRIFSLKFTKCIPTTERRIHQLHFKGWPDHGVPESVFPLLTFMNYVSDIQSTGPIVVHCSAGVGRSGSYILVDSMRRHLINFRRLNLMGHLIHMRNQREKLVQTVEQYELCHEAVRQLIRHGITRVHADLFSRYLIYLAEENINGKSRIQMQYEDLCQCKHVPSCSPHLDPVVLPGYHRLDEFVVVSSSSESESLWELVWQKNCQTILLLGSENFWTNVEKAGEMTVEHGSNFVLLQNREDQLCVRIVPVSRMALERDFWGEMERIQKERLSYQEAPLMVISPCSGTMSSSTRSTNVDVCLDFDDRRSPTFSYHEASPSLPFSICALTALACQLEQQGCIDAVQVLSSYAKRCCGVWSSKADIEFIYNKLHLLVAGSRV